MRQARREAVENDSVAPTRNHLRVGETVQAISVRQQKKAKREGGQLASEKQKEKRKEQKIKAKRKLHEMKQSRRPSSGADVFSSEIGFGSKSHRNVFQHTGPAQVGAEREKKKKTRKGPGNAFKFKEKNGGLKLRKGGKPTGFKSAKRFKRR